MNRDKLIASRDLSKKCAIKQINHPLDPPEYTCGYNTTIDCDDCKYGGHGGRKDPEAKVNQQKH